MYNCQAATSFSKKLTGLSGGNISVVLWVSGATNLASGTGDASLSGIAVFLR